MSPVQRATPAGEDEGRSDQGGTRSGPTLPDGPDTAPALVWLDGWDAGRAIGDAEGYRRGHIDGYAKGHPDGLAEALAEAEAREAARDDVLVRSVAATASRAVPFAVLCERRGDHDRAARARQILTERGVAS